MFTVISWHYYILGILAAKRIMLAWFAVMEGNGLGLDRSFCPNYGKPKQSWMLLDFGGER